MVSEAERGRASLAVIRDVRLLAPVDPKGRAAGSRHLGLLHAHILLWAAAQEFAHQLIAE